MVNTTSPKREFALTVVRRLRDAGYQALWAGGCVRDQLLQIEPKDYDVATDATPPRIREVFGHRHTIAVGAAFGVITVIGSRETGNVEVATFREDAAYSDGRHPDGVTFSTPENDAQRRDFTINGLFFDPVNNQVIDFVGGQADLRAGKLRAIGDPKKRFDEDKLRMLRAVRFATSYDLELDHATRNAIIEHAGELVIVSAERVAEEMRRMLVRDGRSRAVRLLHETSLLPIVIPEVAFLDPDETTHLPATDTAWTRTLRILERLDSPTFATALAALLREAHLCEPRTVENVAGRWRLAKHESVGAFWILSNESRIRRASSVSWPTLQRVLTGDRIEELLTYSSAVASVIDGTNSEIDHCRRKMTLPREEWNPLPLITGDDLKNAGLPAGPVFRDVLDATRDAQLEGRVKTKEQALALALELYETHTKRSSS